MNENEVKKFIVDGEVIAVPSVYQWARLPEKPEYTAQEVGALPDTTTVLQESDFKTINNESIVGAGNIETGSDYSEGLNIKIENDTISAKGYTYDDSNDSFAIGNSGAQAISNGSVAEGNLTVANGEYSHVEGDWTLGLLTEYVCELNDMGTVTEVCCVDPDHNLDNTLSRMDLNRCDGDIPNYFLTITIEVSNLYESYLDFHDAILVYNGYRYRIKDYLKPNNFTNKHSTSFSPSSVYACSKSNEYGWDLLFDYLDYITSNSDFIVLSKVQLHEENNNNTVEINGVHHGKGKIILTKNGLVNGRASHSEGGVNIITGTGSHAEGVNNKIIGNYSHAEGMNNYIEGDYSHAEGTNNKIYGVASHALGVGNVIEADSATCMGTGLFTNVSGLTVIGRYNKILDDDAASSYAFIIGCGLNENDRRNAYAIKWNGNNGEW